MVKLLAAFLCCMLALPVLAQTSEAAASKVAVSGQQADVGRQILVTVNNPRTERSLRAGSTPKSYGNGAARYQVSPRARSSLERLESPQAEPGVALLAHPRSHVEGIRAAIPASGIARLDADTSVSPKSWQAALTAVGAACAAVDDVFSGAASNAFVAARPPGHHAEKATAMGFCLFNNAAIAARHAQKAHGAERIAIVDWDVHHGNGTQDIFWSDPSVLYCSTHQMPLYPGTGGWAETGAGNIVNAPMPPESGSELFRSAFTSRILPAIDGFKPDLIVVSAGFDAHRRDPLAEINLVEGDFDWATGQHMERAATHAGNRLVSLLEGGYDLQGLAFSVAAHVGRLMRG